MRGRGGLRRLPETPGRLGRRTFREGLLNAWQRNFLAVWPSLFVCSMGLMAFVPTLPLYLQDRFGLTDPDELRAWAGAVFAGGPLAAAVLGPFWGALGDRYGRRAMALRAILGIAVVTFLMPFAETPAWLLVLRVLQGVLAGYVAPAMALVSADVPTERQGRTLGRLQVGLALGLLTGPAVGAEIAAGFGRQAVFYFTSAAALVAAVPVLLFARDPREPRKARMPDRSLGLFESGRRFLRSRLFVALLASLFLMRFGQNMVEAYVALWVDELGPLPQVLAASSTRAHAVDRTTAIAFGILAVGQVLLTAQWGRLADRFGPLRCLAILSLSLGVVLVMMGSFRTIEAFIVLRCVAAVFLAGSMTLAYAAVGKRVPDSARSFAFACVQSCVQFGLSLGPFCGGFLSRATGIGGLFFVAAGCVTAAGLGMLAMWRRPFPIVGEE